MFRCFFFLQSVEFKYMYLLLRTSKLSVIFLNKAIPKICPFIKFKKIINNCPNCRKFVRTIADTQPFWSTSGTIIISYVCLLQFVTVVTLDFFYIEHVHKAVISRAVSRSPVCFPNDSLCIHTITLKAYATSKNYKAELNLTF